MHGLVLKRAPARRVYETPILEEYVFVPYDEEGSEPLASVSLQKYCQVCVDQVKQVHKKLQDMGIVKWRDPLLSSSKEDSVDDGKQGKDLKDFSDDENCSLLQTLLKVNSVELNEKFMTNVRNVLTAFKKDLLHDRLLSNHLQARSLKTCLDVVIENSANPLKVLEVQIAGGGLKTPVVNFLKVSPGVQYSYTVACVSGGNEVESEPPKVGTDSIVWDIQEKFQGEQEYDLVIASDVFHEQNNVEKVVQNIQQVIKDNGFLLVTEITHNEILPNTLDVINSRLRQAAEGSNYKTETEWKELFVRTGFCLVAKKSDGLLITTFLLRKTSNDVDGRVLSLDGSHNSWLNRLKDEIVAVQEESTTHKVWLTTNSPEPSGIIGMVHCLRRELGGERVR